MTYMGQLIYLMSGILGIAIGYVMMVAAYDDPRWYIIVLGFGGMALCIGGFIQLFFAIRIIIN